MAEKITLAEINLNMDQAIKDAEALKKKYIEIKAEADKYKGTVKENSGEHIKLQAELKQVGKEYNSQVGLIGKVNAANTTQAGTLQKLEAANAKLRNEQKSLDLTNTKGIKRNKEINKEINKNTETISKNSDKRKQNTMNIGNYTSALGSSGVAINAATSGAKTFGTALKVMLGPLGLIIAAVGALVSYFKRSEEGQNALAKVTAVFSAILDNFLDVIGKVGEALFNAVTKPKEAWQGFKNFIQGVGEFFKNTFGNIIGGTIEIMVSGFLKGFAGIGLAWQKLKGIFVDNAEGINKSQEKINEYNQKIEDGQEKLKKGTENLGSAAKNAYNKAKNALGDFINEQQTEIGIAKQLADEQAQIRKDERKELVENAKLIKESAKLRAEAEKEKYIDAQKSIELFSKSFDVDEKRLANELNIAKRKAEAAKIAASLAKSDIATLDKIAQLEAEVETKEAAFDEKRRERTRRLNAIRKEAFAQEQERLKTKLELDNIVIEQEIRNNNRILDSEEASYAEREKALNDNVDLIQSILDQEAEMKILAIESERDLRLLNEEDAAEQILLIRQQLADGQLQLLNDTIEASRTILEEEKERQLEVAQIDLENDMAIAEGNIFAELDLERKGLELKRQQEIDFANKVGADTAKIDKKYKKAQRALDIAEFNAKLSLTAGFTQNLATIFGEQTAIGKAAAVASATISTIQGAVFAFTDFASTGTPVGFALGVVAAAAALAAGYAQVKQILAVDSGLPGGGGVSASIPSAGGGGFSSISSVSTAPLETGAASVGQGIISRDVQDQSSAAIAAGMSDALLANPLQPTLVTDDVTINQDEALISNRTATI